MASSASSTPIPAQAQDTMANNEKGTLAHNSLVQNTMTFDNMGTLRKFPGEIRNMIYKLVLVDTPILLRRHDAFCDYAARSERDVPIPPYALKLQKMEPKLPVCPCCKRHGLGLLQMCRQIHKEGSTIFWADNAFVFESHMDFVNCVGGSTRKATRELLTHVVALGSSVYPERLVAARRAHLLAGHSSTAAALKRVVQDERRRIRGLWEVVLECSGLRRLELDPVFFEQQGAMMMHIPTLLPRLEWMEATTLRSRAYRGPPNAVPELDQYDLHDRVPTIYFLTSLSVPTDVYAKTADPLDASRKMHAISTAAQRTLTSGIQRAGTELMGIPWPRTLAHLAGEEAGGIPVVNDFPYAAVAMYIDSPRGELTREENNVTLMLMGLPGPESERTEDAARRRRSRRRWWTRLAELPDAVIQGRFWRPIRRERRPTRRMAALLIAVDLVAAEMGLWFSIPRIPRIPRKGVGVVCIAFTIISVLLAVEALDPLYVTWVGGWVSFYLLILGFIFRH